MYVVTVRAELDDPERAEKLRTDLQPILDGYEGAVVQVQIYNPPVPAGDAEGEN